jgi:hypothetical protein
LSSWLELASPILLLESSSTLSVEATYSHQEASESGPRSKAPLASSFALSTMQRLLLAA